ncbi:hypothetical protein ACFL5O_08640 [Myxococcota bacterium]
MTTSGPERPGPIPSALPKGQGLSGSEPTTSGLQRSEPLPSPLPDEEGSSGSEPVTQPAVRSAVERPVDSAPQGEQPGDTLLSAPAPAQEYETELEDRIAAVARQVAELETRLKRLEGARPRNTGRQVARAVWWLTFLVVLAVAWRLLSWIRGP